jgi:hypothetical protein
VYGLAALADALAPPAPDRREAQRLAGIVAGRGACRHPDGAVSFVRSAFEVFADEFARHASAGGCGRRCLGTLPVGAA